MTKKVIVWLSKVIASLRGATATKQSQRLLRFLRSLAMTVRRRLPGAELLPKKGLSLVEVSVATIIFTLILTGMLGIFSQGNRNLRTARLKIAGHNVARGALEQYFSWTDLDALSLAAGVVNGTYTPLPNAPATTLNGVTYTPSLTIADGPCVTGQPGCPPNNALKQVNVTVTWTGGTVTLTTLKANY